jgi:hypothetical protein
MKKYLAGAILLLMMSFFLAVPSARAAIYPFGGRITFISYFSPIGLCGPYVPYIIVVGPKPGVFIIPPLRSYLFYRWQTTGVKVLGLATTPYCGIITSIGTSLY